MAIEVFNRYEQKYILNEPMFSAINEGVKARMESDRYSADGRFYPICNIYYDTQDFHLIRTSLDKPAYKEKIRLRSYGRVNPKDTVFLEIKKKYHGLVNKRRTAISIAEAERFIRTGEMPMVRPGMNEQVVHELSAFIRRYPPLVPKAYVAYDRIAYFDCETHDLRISFDTNLRARDTSLTLTAKDMGVPILSPDYYVLEVKTRFGAPLWLTELLEKNGAKKQSFSKYGTFYQQMLSGENTFLEIPSEIA
ncbi:MAG: polyphosphate polymerase domain-containing protein [Clostridia bacterium]|nr:polyphosphate polymerase domain-containing protein [Clostridia bacterium]